MKIILPSKIIKIIKIFEKNNFLCFVVGGAVRDIILNLKPSEYDLCTNAPINFIKHFFNIADSIGEKNGCFKILFENEYFEITKFREDFNYIDFRHPSYIKYTNSPIIDSKRRDFTINCIYFDGKTIIDNFNGIDDLNNSIIRTINNPNIKFKEDPLRILRALKLKSKLNFKIHIETLLSIKNNIQLIKHLSSSRIHNELKQIFENEFSKPTLNLFKSLKGFKIIIGNNINSKICLEKIVNEFHIRLFSTIYFLSDIDKVLILELIKTYFCFNKKEINELQTIFNFLQKNIKVQNHLNLKTLINYCGFNTSTKMISILNNFGIINNKTFKKFNELKWSYDPLFIYHLNISGKDMFNIENINPKHINKYKTYLLYLTFRYPKLNKRDILLFILNNRISKNKFKF